METKTRIEFAWKLLKAAWKLFLEKEKAVVILLKLSQDIRTKLADEFTPSKDLVRNAVERMPYQPFGVPGLTDTTKYDGNLTEQYPVEGIAKQTQQERPPFPVDTYWLKTPQIVEAGQRPIYEKIEPESITCEDAEGITTDAFGVEVGLDALASINLCPIP